jgi:hypothetical protein
MELTRQDHERTVIRQKGVAQKAIPGQWEHWEANAELHLGQKATGLMDSKPTEMARQDYEQKGLAKFSIQAHWEANAELGWGQKVIGLPDWKPKDLCQQGLERMAKKAIGLPDWEPMDSSRQDLERTAIRQKGMAKEVIPGQWEHCEARHLD